MKSREGGREKEDSSAQNQSEANSADRVEQIRVAALRVNLIHLLRSGLCRGLHVALDMARDGFIGAESAFPHRLVQ